MNRRIKHRAVSLLVATALGASLAMSSAHASHHFENPLATQHPQLDLTDLYVFDAQRPTHTAMMLAINPRTQGNQTDFSKDAVYSFHVASDPSTLDGLTLTVQRDGDDLVFGLLDGANQAVGAKGKEVGRAPIGSEKTFANGMRV